MKNIIIDGEEFELTPVKKKKQKNYEILSWYDRMMGSTINYENCYSNIHSIKRKSDSEVFTVGDAVQSIRSNWQGNDCKIEIIRAKEDGTIDFTINQNGDKGTYRNCLNNFRKVKTPLFLTEDGIEIFEGDYYCHTTLDFQILGSKAGNLSGNLLGKKGYYYFSTEDKAQEWIILNKPMLSIKDIQPIIGKNLEYRNGGSHLDLDKLTEKFKELVQSKL